MIPFPFQQGGFGRLVLPAAGGGGGGGASSALLHFEGADGSTTFTDEVGNAWTAVGNAQIDTAQFKFGASSGLFDGSGDYINTGNNARFGFGSGNWTIEGFFKKAVGATGNRCLVDTRGASKEGIAVYASSSGFTGLGVASNAGLIAETNSNLGGSAFDHFAVCRQGNTLRGYVGGVQVFSVADTRTYASESTCFVGSTYIGGQSTNGWLDELRINKGVCEYPDGTTFTQPSAPFT